MEKNNIETYAAPVGTVRKFVSQQYLNDYKTSTLDPAYAAKSHGTHVTYSTTAPLANGTATAGSAANVSRGDHVHPLQTTVSGNAGTATKLQTARGITVGGTKKTFNGSADISFSLNEIGAAPGKTISATTAATAQWYRIATSAVGINRCVGNFTIEATVSGKHSVTTLVASINYGVNPSIQQLSHSEYSATGISKARIVYHTTHTNNYAYLEVYVPTATATVLNISAVNLVGWTLVTPNTVGSIPSGYTSKEITFVKDKIVANLQGSISGSATSATKATQDSAGQQINTTYIKGLSVSGRTITYTKGDGSTGTITTQDSNTTYGVGTTSALGLTKLYTGTGTATDGTMTQNAITTALNGKAASSHGNHVPTTQTADARKFLRNDNTWQTLPSASTSATGIVQLNDAVNSTSTAQAATANAVKKAYDRAEQAFQSANNGKTSIATAIGSPLSSSDTFSAMVTKINTMTTNLATNLTKVGIEVSSSEKMSTLINKVGEIKSGKKWVSGSIKASGIRTLFRKWNDNSDYNAYYITIPLSFKPSYVIATCKGNRNRWSDDDISVVSGDFIACAGFHDSTVADDEHPSRHSEGRTFSTEKGFDNGNGTYNIPISTSSYTRTFQWIAFE